MLTESSITTFNTAIVCCFARCGKQLDVIDSQLTHKVNAMVPALKIIEQAGHIFGFTYPEENSLLFDIRS